MNYPLNYRKLTRQGLGIFICIFLALLFTELILRVSGYFYYRAPGLSGLNEKQFNIVCFGDSFTYGLGVSLEDSYPKQLERMLNENNPYHRRFAVFNLAVPGCNSSQVLKYFQNILNRYKKPDLIIILTGNNDRWNLTDSNIYKFTKENRPQLLKTRAEIILSNLRVYKMLKSILLNLKRNPHDSDIDTFKSILNGEKIDNNILRRLLEYNLTEIIKLAQSADIKVILQSYPKRDPYCYQATQKIAERFSAPFVDNTSIFNEALRSSSPRGLFLYDLQHPNKHGYNIMAKELHKIICGILKNNK